MAVNTATSSLIIAQLQEIAIELKREFKSTYKELKTSLTEQITLIIIASIVLILHDSSILEKWVYHSTLFDTLITAIFIYSLDILRDTGQAIFEIIQPRD